MIEVTEVTEKSDLEEVVKNMIKKTPRGSLILLSGGLGAGKTEFVRTWLRLSGFSQVTSPTFSLHQEYHVGSRLFHHFDFYRVRDLSEFENIGIDEILAGSFEVGFIELPQSFFENDSRVFFRLEMICEPDGRRFLKQQ